MPIVLNRVDDRLIHGQVVVGWGGPLRIGRFILIDDDVHDNRWEQDLYRMSVPHGVEVSFVSVAEAREGLSQWQSEPVPTMLISGTIEAMAELHDASSTGLPTLNLGGIHPKPGREQVLRYLFLSEDERHVLDRLAGQGVAISAQDVPGSRAIPWVDLT